MALLQKEVQMANLDPAQVITALKIEIAAQSAAIKAALVLIGQMAAKIQSLEAEVAAYAAQIEAAASLTTGVQADSKSLTDAIAQFSASGQLSV